jgi:hypothetical protein
MIIFKPGIARLDLLLPRAVRVRRSVGAFNAPVDLRLSPSIAMRARKFVASMLISARGPRSREYST